MSQELIKNNQISPKFQSLSSLLKAGSQALLLDCSGSMSNSDDNELRRIDRLRNVTKTFEGQIRQFVFYSDYCFEMAEIPEPTGGTGLATALKILKGNGVSHIILITDGRPDSTEDAIIESEGLKIDAFFVGDPTDYGAINFLTRLTHGSGGKFGETTLNKAGEEYLENQILLLIEDSKIESEIINL